MAISSFCRTLLFAALPVCQLVAAQTIVVEDVVIAADETTIAPAAAVVAGFAGPEAFQLTDAILANLTTLQLSNISLFAFESDNDFEKRTNEDSCKTVPGDARWPTRAIWSVLNLLTGDALIDTVPIGAVCYPNSGVYDAAKCDRIIAGWALSSTHSADPTSVMSPIFQGETCMPRNGNSSTCTLGGFPTYVVKISTVAQVQLAINLARNLNLRLVVKNTGHDFLGKSAGAYALSIWTHNLKSINYLASVKTPSYTGPAIKLGAGVQVFELYEAANKYNVTAVGGECDGVGVAGGYIAGGGHSPMSSRLGMGADHVLSIGVVLPNGRFVTADETQNTDLFWALRGGGGGTFGVVTSMTVKVHPKVSVAGASFTVVSGADVGISDDLFWAAKLAYVRNFPQYADEGAYAYSMIFPRGAPGSGYIWSMLPWMVPGMSLADFKKMLAPLLADWKALGFPVEITYFETDNFYDAWSKHFPFEGVANANLRTASRLFPRSNWATEESLMAMFNGVRSVVDEGSALIQYNMKADAPAGSTSNAVNTHWRDSVWYAIFGGSWGEGASETYMEEYNRKITEDWMTRLRVFAPGGYGNEGDVMEPEFGDAFFGASYDRLLQIKRQVDPNDVFWAPTAVGSDRFYIEGSRPWLTQQNGRLCKKAA
ncbi:hypothetical protein B0H63DRAFT_101611 [Podospora didyma]|uniref:FAD-binding PCMH-type domain-containing protein n=1 Tax=Podospora didyma TaxID=330526 RepID=A0AAE0U3T1_9PEZI|nr:hypothetical protein B0H63DRAFT_101611 [Podospora didyma]